LSAFLILDLQSKIERAGNKNGLVTLGIIGNVSLLLYYKYTAFILENINELLTEDLRIAIPKIIVPVGVSFTTFQSISYLVDVYRGTCKAERNVISYLVYAFLFPHLIAGPIVRYVEIKNDIQKRNESISDVYLGFIRFSIGFAKKVLVAEVLGHTADSIFALPSDQLKGSLAWLGIISYTFQIYFDFS
jgi:D-alanyl-lipoteichoic acid acyltransferase DltB (MBOAT superfamily)